MSEIFVFEKSYLTFVGSLSDMTQKFFYYKYYSYFFLEAEGPL